MIGIKLELRLDPTLEFFFTLKSMSMNNIRNWLSETGNKPRRRCYRHCY